MTQFIDIDSIPQKYGGGLKFRCGDLPNLDPELRDYLDLAPVPDAERYFLTAPVHWLDAGEDGEMSALSVGTSDGKQRQERIATLHGTAKRVATHRDRLSRANTQQSATASLAPSGVSSTGPRPLSQSQASHVHPTSPLATSSTTHATQQIQEEQIRQSQATTTSPLAKSNATAESKDAKVAHDSQPGERPDEAAAAIMASLSVNGTVQNGGPPERISIPPPPATLEKEKTVYMTPASDPSELKNLS